MQMLPFGFDGDFNLEDTRGKVDFCQLKLHLKEMNKKIPPPIAIRFYN